ncbi:MAG TPA: hypothetical protein VHC71_09130 [Hyphomicrobium sp.]|jgi:hypothetical protein|nr:hypothetical protein [Hyphomicrobium sp.]
MQDLLWQLEDTDAFTVYMALAFAAAVFWFIREIVDAPTLAVVSVPFLVAGGIVSPLVFRSATITFADDQDTNIAAMVAIGVVTALGVIVGFKWLWALLLEHQARRTRLEPVVPRPRGRR